MGAAIAEILEAINPNLPPMLKQYLEYKQKYPDCLIFFQVGDFYEVFFEDAVLVAKSINITLTSRDKSSPNPVPMCGVPLAVIDSYLDRLVALNHSVAIISQVGQAGVGKGMVERALERIITPGVRLLSNSDSDAEAKYVAALCIRSEKDLALATSCPQTGEIHIRDNFEFHELLTELKQANICELVLPKVIGGKGVDRRVGWVRQIEKSMPTLVIHFRSAELKLGVEREKALRENSSYSSLPRAAKQAVHFLVSYIDEVTVGRTLQIETITRRDIGSHVYIDADTRRNLEILENLYGGDQSGSLYSLLNRTLTCDGSRLLREWLFRPLKDLNEIDARQGLVATFVDNFSSRYEIREKFRYFCDLERVASRIDLQYVSPPELASLRDTLRILPSVVKQLVALDSEVLHESRELVRSLVEALGPAAGFDKLEGQLEAVLAEEPRHVISQGGVVKEGYSAELDRQRGLKEKSKEWIQNFEKEQRELTGISSLRVKFNGVIGYFIEVTKANVKRVPDAYVKRQATTNSERFVVPELKQMEDELVRSESRQIELEQEIFSSLKRDMLPWVAAIRSLSRAVAQLDVLLSFAEVATNSAWVRPKLNDGLELKIVEGAHPVLQGLLGPEFINNSLTLRNQKNRSMIITGPNMGGKSTFLRQTALIIILAQIGSFVPVKEAEIGLVDKIFARIGASDNILEGESTFMVEMKEAAQIIGNATERSLILIDELGRGTATADGLSIARAVLEWLVLKIKSRTLFATHFHELTDLEAVHLEINNLSVTSIEQAGEVIFTHQIASGAAKRSYGIEVAKLAGLPAALIKRARLLLSNYGTKANNTGGQLSIFDISPEKTDIFEEEKNQEYDKSQELISDLNSLNLDELTPLEALNWLHKQKAKYT